MITNAKMATINWRKMRTARKGIRQGTRIIKPIPKRGYMKIAIHKKLGRIVCALSIIIENIEYYRRKIKMTKQKSNHVQILLLQSRGKLYNFEIRLKCLFLFTNLLLRLCLLSVFPY